MIIGVTATRKGLTKRQLASCWDLLGSLSLKTLHHGDCIGGDAQFHRLAHFAKAKRIVIHPPSVDIYRAWCKQETDETVVDILTPLPYLVRDKNIVRASEVMIGCPKGFKEEIRSGTWATLRFASKISKPRYIVYPDGTVLSYNIGEGLDI